MQWPYWGKFTGPYLTLNSWDRRGIQGYARPICCSMWPMGSLSCSFRSKTQRRDSLRKWHHFWFLWAESLTLPPDSSWRDSPALPVKDDASFCLYLLLWTRCPFSFFHFFLTFCFCQSGLCCLGFQLVRNVNALYFELFFFCFLLLFKMRSSRSVGIFFGFRNIRQHHTPCINRPVWSRQVVQHPGD